MASLKEEAVAPPPSTISSGGELAPRLVAARVELASYYLERATPRSQPLLEGALRFDTNNVSLPEPGDCYRLAGRIAEAKAQFDWCSRTTLAGAGALRPRPALSLRAEHPRMDAKRQTDEAIAEINKYQQMRGKLAAGQSDDSEELLNRAKQKQADLLTQASEKASAGAKAPAGAASAASSAAKPPAAKPGAK